MEVWLWWCGYGGVVVAVRLWWCGCGGVVVIVQLWWCDCGGVVVVLWLWWCGCGGVFVVVWLWLCGCGGSFSRCGHKSPLCTLLAMLSHRVIIKQLCSRTDPNHDLCDVAVV